MTQFIQDKNSCAQAFLWAFRADTLKEQVRWYEALCRQAVRSYGRYLEACKKPPLGSPGRARRLFEDSLLLQADILHGCYEVLWRYAKACCAVLAEITWEVFTMQERRRNHTGIQMRMRAREHGKWHGFYENEVPGRYQAEQLGRADLMGYFRVLGDGPHFISAEGIFGYRRK